MTLAQCRAAPSQSPRSIASYRAARELLWAVSRLPRYVENGTKHFEICDLCDAFRSLTNSPHLLVERTDTPTNAISSFGCCMDLCLQQTGVDEQFVKGRTQCSQPSERRVDLVVAGNETGKLRAHSLLASLDVCKGRKDCRKRVYGCCGHELEGGAERSWRKPTTLPFAVAAHLLPPPTVLTMEVFSRGTRVWLQDKELGWISAEVTSNRLTGENVKLTLQDERGKVCQIFIGSSFQS